ncbi:MAG: hypothetical protein QM692_15160 [Thermomicrobiales bacterium]
MDSQHFDALTRALSTPRVRRRFLAGVAALPVAGGLLGLFAGGEADARRRKRRKRNKKKKTTPKCAPNCAGKCGGVSDGCGGACSACAGTTPICQGEVCIPCSASTPCPDGCCQPDGSCGATCRVFLTSTLQNGKLGGLAGADALCQGLAEDAGLSGTYMAWLSDTASSPGTRFPLAGSATVGPYALVGAPYTTVADNWTDLITCDDDFPNDCLQHAIDRAENGQTQPNRLVWTGVSANSGNPSNTCCTDWSADDSLTTGMIGQSWRTANTWVFATGDPCNITYALYCFQQG